MSVFRGRFVFIVLCLFVAEPARVSAETVQYGYDASGRLIRATYGDGSYSRKVIDYYYDAVGNRTRRAEGLSILSVQPESLNFGTVDESGMSLPLSIVLSNQGNIPVTLEGFHLSGPEAGEFRVLDPLCVLPVMPGDGCTVYLAMAPASGGHKAATLEIISDAPNSPMETVTLSGFGTEWYSVTVVGSGSGLGRVSVTPSGSTGSLPFTESFAAGTAVTLSAVPDQGFVFLGWTGPCSGTDDCALSLTSDMHVGAAFAYPVRADFGVDGLLGTAPLYVGFADLSDGQPTQWEWDFGDGSSAGLEQNPRHLYEVPGTYSVVFSAANSETSDTLTREDWIRVVPWDAGLWTGRIPLLIDYHRVEEDLPDFPVRLHLSGASGVSGADVREIFRELGSEYRRMAVITAGGEPCWVEVDTWDAVNETADLWVRVPNIRADRDTILSLLYDASGPVNGYIGETGTPAAAHVWEQGYEAVYHMSHDPSGSIVPDSTLRHAGTAVDLFDANLVDGVAGKGLRLPASNGSNNFVPAPYINAGNLSLTRDLALEAFLYPEFPFNHNYWARILDKSACRNTNESYRLHYNVTGHNWVFVLWDGSGYGQMVQTATGSYVPHDWQHVAATFDGTTMKIFQNGTLDPSALSEGFSGRTLRQTVDATHIGVDSHYCGYTEALQGILDEVRISSVSRSDAWIKTTYLSLRDALVTFPGAPRLVAAMGPSEENTSEVVVMDRGFGKVSSFLPFDAATARYGARVSLGDVDADGQDEIIVGMGEGEANPTEIKLFETDGLPLTGGNGIVFPSSFRFGARVSSGDFNGDGKDEILVGTSRGRPWLRILSYDSEQVSLQDTGAGIELWEGQSDGVNLSAADLDNDGRSEIIAATSGIKHAPMISVWSVNPSGGMGKWSMSPYTGFNTTGVLSGVSGGGAQVAAGRDIVAFGSGAQGGLVDLYDAAGNFHCRTHLNDPTIRQSSGLELSVGDLEGDGAEEVWVGAGHNAESGTEIRIIDRNCSETGATEPVFPGAGHGVRISVRRRE